MPIDAILNQSAPNVILTAHATKVNRTEPNWTEPQTCLACQNHAWIGSRTEYLTPLTYNIVMILLHSNLLHSLALLAGFNTIYSYYILIR